MAGEVKSITSESLEAAYRALTPSQSGFTQDLQASNTIIPVLDLTASAEGTTVPQYQAQALAFASQTAFEATNATQVCANTAGFWRVTGSVGIGTSNGVTSKATITMSDGLSTKNVWRLGVGGAGGAQNASVPFDLVLFLRSGDSFSVSSDAGGAIIAGSYRQGADVNGVVVNPSGFTPQ